MAAASNMSVTIPQPSVPFVGADGTIARPWLYYMVGIFNRTGGPTGMSSATLQQQIIGLQVEEAMDDVAFPAAVPVFDVMSGDDSAPNPVVQTLLALSLVDDAPRASLNPFLASLLVADAT
jgi:hypothetical protein